MFCKFKDVDDNEIFSFQDYNVTRVSPSYFFKKDGKIYNLNKYARIPENYTDETECRLFSSPSNLSPCTNRLYDLGVVDSFSYDGFTYKVKEIDEENHRVICDSYGQEFILRDCVEVEEFFERKEGASL